MNLKWTIIYVTVLLLLATCTSNTVLVKNEKQGRLKASVKLEVSRTKKIELDENTAPKPLYTQLFKSSNGIIYFTFLNNFNNSVYFYDYDTQQFVKRITWEKIGPKSIPSLTGYYIKSLDSIYLFNRSTIEIILSNDVGSLLKRISLRGNRIDANWDYKYPQYNPQTVRPFIETSHELLLTGFFFGTVPESIITDFKFTARLDFKTSKLSFDHSYPPLLYGSGYNWEGDLFTEVYSDLHADGDKLVLSFPVSHDLYIVDLITGEYKRVYGGSNFAGTISSINNAPKRSSKEEILSNIIKQNEYTAIKYDKFRKLYYRFLLKSVSDATMDWNDKPISVIVMDENFNYLGETVIGTGKEWYWQNSFVTSEGLNIEYIEKDFDETTMTLKIFTLKKI